MGISFFAQLVHIRDRKYGKDRMLNFSLMPSAFCRGVTAGAFWAPWALGNSYLSFRVMKPVCFVIPCPVVVYAIVPKFSLSA